MENSIYPPCEKCGYIKEMTLKSLILQAAMRADIRKDSSLSDDLQADIFAISPELHQELKKEGTQHRYADKTLTELKEIYS